MAIWEVKIGLFEIPLCCVSVIFLKVIEFRFLVQRPHDNRIELNVIDASDSLAPKFWKPLEEEKTNWTKI